MGRMLATRLGFGMGYAPAPTADYEVFTVSAAPDGAWAWFGDPNVTVVHGEYAYIGYVDTSGNVALRVHNLTTGVTGSEIVLKAALDVDDHVNPAFLVRPDGKLQAFYCRHEPLSTDMHTRVSVNTLASDPTLSGGFATEVNLDAQLGARSYDYPMPFYLSAEGLIYLFWRDIPTGSSYRLNYSTSVDGDTWTSKTLVYQNTTKTGRAYWRMIGNGVDRIDIAVTDGTPNIDTTHLAHFYYDGTWRGSDGTDLGPPVFNFDDFTPVHTSSNCMAYDIDQGPDGHPRILFQTFAGSFSAHLHNYARWTGSAWTKTEIAPAGNGIDTATRSYSPGMCFLRGAPDTAYLSREVSGQYEMFRYVTGNDGVSWTATQLTTGSAAKNIRPVSPRGQTAALRALWMYGAYTAYSGAGFNTGIRGLRD